MCYQPIILEQYYDSLGRFYSHYVCDYDPLRHDDAYFRRMSLTRRHGQFKFKYVVVPCGKCIECRRRSARDWKVRLYHHSLTEGDSLFVTLTYDDEHMDSPHLNYRHYQLFMKRFRRSFPGRKISFFCVGEYGSRSFRRHFHCIIFGVDINEVRTKFLCTSRKNKKVKIWTSDLISRCWDNRGFVSVSRVVSGDAAAFGYVSGYILSKSDARHIRTINDFGLVPEFHHMSLKPCIGRKYFDNNYKEFYNRGFCFFNSSPCSIPRAYDFWYKKLTERFVVRRGCPVSSPVFRLGLSVCDYLRTLVGRVSTSVLNRFIFELDDKFDLILDKVSDFDIIKKKRKAYFSSSTCKRSFYNFDSRKANFQTYLGAFDRDVDTLMEEFDYV